MFLMLDGKLTRLVSLCTSWRIYVVERLRSSLGEKVVGPTSSGPLRLFGVRFGSGKSSSPGKSWCVNNSSRS
jgi:hypothetical protein